MTEQKERHRKRDEKLQHRDERRSLGWGGGFPENLQWDELHHTITRKSG